VIHDPTLNEIKGQAESVWRTVLEVLKRIRETIQSPNLVVEQLQIVFRDERKPKNNILKMRFYFFNIVSRSK
jgi:hypothetical protein